MNEYRNKITLSGFSKARDWAFPICTKHFTWISLAHRAKCNIFFYLVYNSFILFFITRFYQVTIHFWHIKQVSFVLKHELHFPTSLHFVFLSPKFRQSKFYAFSSTSSSYLKSLIKHIKIKVKNCPSCILITCMYSYLVPPYPFELLLLNFKLTLHNRPSYLE